MIGEKPAMTIRGEWDRAARRLTAAGVEQPEREASLLLRIAMALSKEEFYCKSPAEGLTLQQHQRLNELVAGREKRIPLPYLTGTVEFYGRNFQVSPKVLIPRPETEHLVESVLDWLAAKRTAEEIIRLADLGTGSGAIAVTLALEDHRLQILASDISSGCLETARMNAEQHGVQSRIRFIKGNWYEALRLAGWDAADLIVSNPPYVTRGDDLHLPPELRHEPGTALYAGNRGYQDLEVLAAGASQALAPAGAIFLEIGAGQFGPIAERLNEAGLTVFGRRDYAGHRRVIAGEKNS